MEGAQTSRSRPWPTKALAPARRSHADDGFLGAVISATLNMMESLSKPTGELESQPENLKLSGFLIWFV